MMRNRWQAPTLGLRVLALLGSMALVVGCGAGTGGGDNGAENLGRLGLYYGMYASHHQGNPPATRAKLQAFVEERATAEKLQDWGVTDVDELFVSPRDGQPYQFVPYPSMPAPVGGKPLPVVLHEQTGRDGKRMVAFLGGGTQEVDDAGFQKLMAGEFP